MIDPNTWTGERLETFVYNDTTFEHLHRYALSLQLARGKKVLDIACGEGYGSHLMAAVATEVIGVDIAQETIDFAREKYQRPNLHFLPGSADTIPCQDDYFDLVVSFETIEHHDRHQEMMQEIKRVLKRDGVLVISSPDRRFYSEKPGGYQNPYHVKELYKEEFQQLLQQYFRHTQMLSQSSFIGSVVLPDETVPAGADMYDGTYQHINQSTWEPLYCIALAADVITPPLSGSFFNGTDVLEERMQQAERNMYDTMARQIADVTTFEVTERVTREVTDYVTHQVSQRVAEQVTREVTDYVTYEVTKQVTAAVTQQVTEQVTREVTEQVTQDVTLRATLVATAETEQRMQNTTSYKLGAAVLKPVQYINRLFNRKR